MHSLKVQNLKFRKRIKHWKLTKTKELLSDLTNVAEKCSKNTLICQILNDENDFLLCEKQSNRTDNGSQPECISELVLISTSYFSNNNLCSLLSSGSKSDITVKVQGVCFFGHKCVLSARSLYFRCMFESNNWIESDLTEVEINGISVRAFGIYLCYIYGVFVDFSAVSNFPTLEVASAADMLGSTVLLEAVELYLYKEKCHLFHQPCSGCLTGFNEALSIAATRNLPKLKECCLEWNSCYFPKLWRIESFCKLPSNLLEECYLAVENTLTVSSVGDITLGADLLLGGLTSVSWEKPMVRVATRLMHSCEDYIAKNLYEITVNGKWDLLFQGLGCRREIVERILKTVCFKLEHNNVCTQYNALTILLEFADSEEWNPIVKPLRAAAEKAKMYLTSNCYAVMHTKGWTILPEDFRTELQASTLSCGDPTRKPASKPVLSSSKMAKTKPKVAITKESRKHGSSTRNIPETLKGKTSSSCKTTKNKISSSNSDCQKKEARVKQKTPRKGHSALWHVKVGDIPPLMLHEKMTFGSSVEDKATKTVPYCCLETLCVQHN